MDKEKIKLVLFVIFLMMITGLVVYDLTAYVYETYSTPKYIKEVEIVPYSR